jgi:exodeoxyribonuclease VII large subunit
VVDLRCPKMNLVMAYVALQGDGAPQSIILALSSLTKMRDIDTIILARGGGPSEDFMAFNDEEMVRAIASSTKPIITGIGHESDVCLADLASDLRASTPSTAARAAIPDILELRNNLNPLKLGLERSYKSYLLAFDAKEMEVKVKREELQKLRNGLSSLRTNLDRSYDAYLLGLKIKENEVEMDKKDEEIEKAMEGGKSDLLKYKAIIAALIVFLVVILIFLLKMMS